MKYTGPKVRLSRREGVNLSGAQKKALTRKPYAPGMHGQARKKALSNYGKQLRAKQLVKRIYNLSEKQFYKYYVVASNKKGITGDIMMELLELRLDNVIYQSGLALTRYQSRQMVSHSHFLVNGRKMNIPSYQVKKGDVITVKDSKKQKGLFEKERLKQIKPFARWLEFSATDYKIIVLDEPKKEDFDSTIDIKTVVEFYSR